MRLKSLETRHITLRHIQILGLNELKWIYGLIYKNQAELEGVVETQFKTKVMKFWFDYWNIYTLHWFFCANNCLADWYYSRESGLDLLYCQNFGRSYI